MIGKQGEFVEQVKQTVESMLAQVHTCAPGKIVSFDPVSCQATVLPAMKIKRPNGELLEYPQITGVPVLFPQSSAQGTTIAYPVKAGDGCLVLFSEQALDQFLYQRDTGTDLRFDLSNAVEIVGIFAKGNSAMKKACANGSIVIQNRSVSVEISPGGVNIVGNVTIVGDLTTTGGKVNLN